MLKAVVFIVGVALLIILVNSTAEYRADNDLIYRLCDKRVEVIADLRELLNSKERQGNNVMKNTRDSMISAKLLFILPQRPDEPVDSYLFRTQDYLTERCSP